MPSLLASPSPQGVWVRAAALELRGRSGAATLLDPEHPLQLLELPAQPVTVPSLHRGPAGHLATSISSGQINIIRLILTWSDLLEGMGELPPSDGMSTIPWMWSFVSCSFLLASLTRRIRMDWEIHTNKQVNAQIMTTDCWLLRPCVPFLLSEWRLWLSIIIIHISPVSQEEE